MIGKERGFTLVEMSLVLVILGLVAVVAVKLAPRISALGQDSADPHQFLAIQDALTGFVFARGRLPCPDGNADGVEDCASGLARGGVPYTTLGMAGRARNRVGLSLLYAVYRNNSAPGDADLATGIDRYLPLLPAGTSPIALETALGNRNALDICEALHSAGLAATDNAYLHVGLAADARNMAWLLVDPGAGDADGDGNALDGLNATGIGFERADRAMNAGYDDRVVAMAFGPVWSKLGCASAFSAAGHAHANAALTAVIMLQAMSDYDTQLELMADMADADVATAVALQLMSDAGIAAAASEARNAAAQALITAGASSPNIAVAAAAVAANVAAAIVTGIAVAAADNAKNLTAALLADFRAGVGGNPPLATQANTLSVSIRQNAVDADAAGLFTR